MGKMRLAVLFTFVLILILSSFSTTQERIRRHQPRSVKGEVSKIPGFGIFNDENKPSCKQSGNRGTTFCEQTFNYPKRYLERLIKNSKLSLVSKQFFVDRKTLNNKMPVVSRTDDEDGQDYMCPSMRLTILPQMAQTTKGEWKYIPNHGTLSQVVEVELCYETGACSMLGYVQHLVKVVSQCKQTYLARKLISFDESQNPIVESFLFPSACVCTYAMPISRSFNPML